jgi:hypothetical protein
MTSLATASDFSRNKEYRKLEAAQENYFDAMQKWHQAVNQKIDRMTPVFSGEMDDNRDYDLELKDAEVMREE